MRSTDIINNEKLRERIQSANINFMFGSGISRPYLETLGKIEEFITKANEEPDGYVKDRLISSLYKKYFDVVISPNVIDEETDKYIETLKNYIDFLKIWNEIILRRYSNILNKQINIFSTNIDMFVEKAADKLKVELNDGFKGNINPIFDEGNYQKTYSRVSEYYQNISEIPSFNLMKIHGSINWKQIEGTNELTRLSYRTQIKKIKRILSEIGDDKFIAFDENSKYSDLKSDAEFCKIVGIESVDYSKFEDAYEKFVMINPNKTKFSHSVLDLHFYELMRIFSNALERQNSILFVEGFSFADEHIAKIVKRAADSNPTLLVIIFAYENSDVEHINKNLGMTDNSIVKNNNIYVVSTEDYKKANNNADDEKVRDFVGEIAKFDFETINKLYSLLLGLDIDYSNGKK